jgi:hypothetical protein
MLMAFLLAACTYTTSTSEVITDPKDEHTLSHLCSMGEVKRCYQLRSSKDRARRTAALSTACDAAFKDSCRLLYDFAKDGRELGDSTFAFSAAVDGCRQGDTSLCKAALDFASIHPDHAPVVEKHRAELEALLADQER